MTPASFIGHNPGGTLVTPEDHFAQVAAVRASLLLGTDRTERHQLYPRRRPGGGWLNGSPVNTAHGHVLQMVAAVEQHRASQEPRL